MVQFYPWFKFCFSLLLDMLMYDNEYETKENIFKPRIKLHHNIYTLYLQDAGSWLQFAPRQETSPFCIVLSSDYPTKYLAN